MSLRRDADLEAAGYTTVRVCGRTSRFVEFTDGSREPISHRELQLMEAAYRQGLRVGLAETAG